MIWGRWVNFSCFNVFICSPWIINACPAYPGGILRESNEMTDLKRLCRKLQETSLSHAATAQQAILLLFIAKGACVVIWCWLPAGRQVFFGPYFYPTKHHWSLEPILYFHIFKDLFSTYYTSDTLIGARDTRKDALVDSLPRGETDMKTPTKLPLWYVKLVKEPRDLVCERLSGKIVFFPM